MRILRKAVIGAALVLGTGVSPFPAAAQLPGAATDYVEGGFAWRRGIPPGVLPTPFTQGGSCVRWCVADASPCDPDYYKVADRRCNINQNGYFPK